MLSPKCIFCRTKEATRGSFCSRSCAAKNSWKKRRARISAEELIERIYVKGQSRGDVARLLGVSRATIRRRLDKGVLAQYEKLARAGSHATGQMVLTYPLSLADELELKIRAFLVSEGISEVSIALSR